MIIKRIFSGGDNLQKHLKDSVFHIVCERNLCSCMNNTKWCELINAIKMEMPFPPAFSMKYITEESAAHSRIKTEDVDYWGDWTGENFPSQEYYFNIEWIKVRPCYLKYRGKMIAPELVDESKIFKDILKRYNIPFEEKDGLYCIYGYK